MLSFSVFFFNDPATTEIYTLSLHDAVPFDPHRRPAGPRVAGMARQLHVLDRARAGAGGVRSHAEARKGPLVGALDPLRRGGGGVPDRVARALRRAVPRPLLDLQLAARAPARHRRVAHDEVLLRAEWADLRRPRVAVVALRATRHGARPGGAR